MLKVDPQIGQSAGDGERAAVGGGYVFFGWLSDRIGRKPVMLFGMILSAALYLPGFHALTAYANPALEAAAQRAPVSVVADPKECHFQFDPLGRATFDSSCDVARRILSEAGVPYRNVSGEPGSVAQIRVGNKTVLSKSMADLGPQQSAVGRVSVGKEVLAALSDAGYPRSASKTDVRQGPIVGILLLFLLASAALYGPQAAALVELFPSRVRYTALSFPTTSVRGGSAACCPSPRSRSLRPPGTSTRACGIRWCSPLSGFWQRCCCFLRQPDGRSPILQMTVPTARGLSGS